MTYCSLEKADSPKARKYRCQLLKRRQEEMGEKFLGETPDSLTDGTFLGFPRGIKEFYLREIFSEMEQVRQKNPESYRDHQGIISEAQQTFLETIIPEDPGDNSF